jgi:hypothetical protein
VVLVNVTETAVTPVLPALSVTRQRHNELYVAFTLGTLRDQIVLLELGLFTFVDVSPEMYCHAYV